MFSNVITGAARGCLAAGCLLACLLVAPTASMARATTPPLPAAQPDVSMDFHTLARQKPWRCEGVEDDAGVQGGWSGGVADCAWQNRLRVRSWRGAGGMHGNACVSTQAHWWNWARGRGAALAAQPPAWRSNWTSQSIAGTDGPEQRVVILRRLDDGNWSVTEWRWNPSPRAATRAWQQGRWNLLAARAEQLRMPAGHSGASDAERLQKVLELNAGTRPAEMAGTLFRWRANGLCLQVDGASLGPQQLQLPYSVDDTRLEQRAAMQLQLARRFPEATWLTPFSLIPTPRHVRSGAKFYAIWREGATLKGQLWMPVKGDRPLVRARIVTPLPAGAEPGYPRQAVERELMGLAARWAFAYE